MRKYLNHFTGKRKNNNLLVSYVRQLSKRQIVAVCFIGIAFIANFSYASIQGTSDHAVLSNSFDTMYKVLSGRDYNANEITGDKFLGYVYMFTSGYWIIDLIKNIMQYIVRMQTGSIQFLADADFGSIYMFEHIVQGLTIFAVIGCIYRLVMHFLNTERFDNVRAYTGFFSYLGIFVLFIFSNQIVDRVVRLNQPMNASVINNIFVRIDNELNKQITADFKITKEQLEKIEQDYKKLDPTDFSDKIGNRLEFVKIQLWDMGGKYILKYSYYAFFSIILAVVLAVPAFTIAFMVKILLGIMVAGAKLVFLLSFIPGFENTWKTFMMNLLNVILWVPIFTAIISFLTLIVERTISDQSLEMGQIVWLTLVVCVGAYQSLSLTTTGAAVIIQGTGASMAGAMGSLAGMNAASMVAGAGQAAIGTAVTAATGGAASGAAAAAAMKKYAK